MKNIKNIALFAVIFVGHVFPMRMTERGKKFAMSSAQRLVSYFIYSLETTEGIWVNKRVAKENSEYIKMLSQRNISNEIGLPFSIESIKVAFDVLSHPNNIHNFSLEQLINTLIVFDFLIVPAHTMEIVLNETKRAMQISNDVDINIGETLKQLPDHIQKLLLTDIVIQYLKHPIDIKVQKEKEKQYVDRYIDLWVTPGALDYYLLEEIKNYNADQLRLTYKLCLQSLHYNTIQLQPEEQEIFNALPKKWLTNLLFPYNWLLNLWQ